MRQIICGGAVFDGTRLLPDMAVVIEDGLIADLIPASDAPTDARRHKGVISPGLIDLQVNGSGGLWVGAETTAGSLARICESQLALGTTGCLPTLITDRPEVVASVLAAGVEAARRQVPGFLGLHMEGPHLDPRRKGAHDPALIRPMQDDDLDRLCQAAAALPALMVTLAPEAVRPDQIAALAAAGAVISLGHSDCTHEQAMAAMRAGARCATHLFNAMSQIGHRAPGLAGAVLSGQAGAGLIADGIHVHPAVMALALAARPGGIFLVSDCMAFAGTDQTEMELNGRQVLRRDGRLTLADGTLAGADLTLPQAIATLTGLVGIAPERALAMATSEPARLIGLQASHGALLPGRKTEMVRLTPDFQLIEHWL